MITEKMREEFLVWWRDDFQRELRRSCAEGWAFHIWQASRAVIEVELPRQHGVHYPRMFSDEVRTAIESLGLKVKP